MSSDQYRDQYREQVSIENSEGNDEFPDLTNKYMYVRSIEDIPDREIIGGEIPKKNILQLIKCFCIDVIGIFYKKKEEGDIVAVLYQRRA